MLLCLYVFITCLLVFICKHITVNSILRKVKCSPAVNLFQSCPANQYVLTDRRVHLFAPLQAGLTVEAAVALPVFFLCMMIPLQMCNALGTAARLSEAMAQTAEEMAIGAYAVSEGEDASVLGRAVTVAAARAGTLSRAGDTNGIKGLNFLLSAFGSGEETVDLTATWQLKNPTGLFQIPGFFAVQRAAVRKWTGRTGSGLHTDHGGDHESSRTVYVAENGTVYHTDPNCTHIHLSIQKVDRSSLGSRRNEYGEKYHPCEHCHGGDGDTVYITGEGNRYHSSLDCSGLKRTVSEMTLEEAGDLRPCSRCAGGHAD